MEEKWWMGGEGGREEEWRRLVHQGAVGREPARGRGATGPWGAAGGTKDHLEKRIMFLYLLYSIDKDTLKMYLFQTKIPI